jgi:hypothetical protein
MGGTDGPDAQWKKKTELSTGAEVARLMSLFGARNGPLFEGAEFKERTSQDRFWQGSAAGCVGLSEEYERMGGEGGERRATLEKERNGWNAAAFPMCVRKAVAGNDFVEKVPVFGGWLRKAQLPVAGATRPPGGRATRDVRGEGAVTDFRRGIF